MFQFAIVNNCCAHTKAAVAASASQSSPLTADQTINICDVTKPC